ncbi:MAG: class I SAM-dependent methyltransferase [Candidatus Methylomirabilia bacterium]
MDVTDAPRTTYTLKPDPYSSHSVILSWLSEGRGRRLLDVGAADGLLSRPLAEHGWRVTGIERDPALAAAGAAHCERMLVVDLDREAPDLDGPFDVIVYADVLEHLIDPVRALVTVNRTLAPHGHVIISVPNVAHLWIRLSLLLGRFEYTDRGILDRTHLRFFTGRSLRRLIADAGLRSVRRTTTPTPLYQVVPARFHGAWLAGIHAGSAVAARWLPRLLGYQFVVLARLGSS